MFTNISSITLAIIYLHEILMSSLHCIFAADFRPRGCCYRPRTLPDEADVQTKETGLIRPQDGEE